MQDRSVGRRDVQYFLFHCRWRVSQNKARRNVFKYLLHFSQLHLLPQSDFIEHPLCLALEVCWESNCSDELGDPQLCSLRVQCSHENLHLNWSQLHSITFDDCLESRGCERTRAKDIIVPESFL
jgi:hypothetical protein